MQQGVLRGNDSMLPGRLRVLAHRASIRGLALPVHGHDGSGRFDGPDLARELEPFLKSLNRLLNVGPFWRHLEYHKAPHHAPFSIRPSANAASSRACSCT